MRHSLTLSGVLEELTLHLVYLSSELNESVQFLPERFLVVPDAVQVGAGARCILNHPAGFFELLVIQAKEPQLCCVEGSSARTMDGCSRPKGNQSLIAR